MASTYRQVAYGSTGADVKKLQQVLNDKGYGLAEDGVFGVKTQAAVRDYQKKNSLKLDGIAGPETWGSLMARPKAEEMGTAAGSPAVSRETMEALGKLEAGYRPSAEVEILGLEKEAIAAQKPKEYVSGFEEQMAALYQAMVNREKFTYDPAEDAAFGSYAEVMMGKGKAAMEDAVGVSSGLTGGYGSSYAQSAGQQAYEKYLGLIDEALGRYRQSAYEAYKDRGRALLDQYELLQGQDEEAYRRWQEGVKVWQEELDRAESAYDRGAANDLKNYQMMLDYYLDKVSQEIAAAKGGVTMPAAAVSSIGNTASLSSTAAESLQRTVEHYLKRGEGDRAQMLYGQYAARLTPAQKKHFETMMAKYGN